MTSTTSTVVSVGGVAIASDWPLPLAPSVTGAADPAPAIDIRATSGTFPPFGTLIREIRDSARGCTTFSTFESEAGLHWLVSGVGRFAVSPDGTRVTYEVESGARPADVEHVLLGPVIGMALQQMGRVLLHAGAVVHGSGVIAFTGPSGFGKSTLAGWFGRHGYELMADDILPIAIHEGSVLATTYIPRLKLCEDAIEAFGDDPAQFERGLGWVAKRNVVPGPRWGRFADAQQRLLKAVYLMGPLHGVAAPRVESVAPHDALLALLPSMYMGELLAGTRARAAFEAASQLVATTPVRHITYGRSLEGLPALAHAIIEDAETLHA